MTNNTFNVNAQNVGVVAGKSSVEGGVHQKAGNQTEQAQAELQKLLELLDKAGDHAKAHEGKQLAVEAKSKPTKSMVEKVLGWMRVAKAGGDLLVTGADDYAKIAEHLHVLLPHLPHG